MSSTGGQFEHHPHAPIIKELDRLFENPQVQEAFDKAIGGVSKEIPGVDGSPPTPNPWYGRTSEDFANYFNNWFHFLPTPGGGLGFIVPFTYFYFDNPAAFDFLNNFELDGKEVIFDWTVRFVQKRGEFMDTPSPEADKAIDAWVSNPVTHIDEFIMPSGGYTTFNDFFTRKLRPGARPIAAVDDDSVVVSPADSELNMINASLGAETRIPTKGSQQLSVPQLLNNFEHPERFYDGTALSCVLLPANYHHYHSPVTGEIVHAEVVPGIYFGIEDAPTWFHNGNVGDSDSDFTIFEQFHRGVVVIRTKRFGYVAMVPVGLNTISSVVLELNSVILHAKYTDASEASPIPVYKGDELGLFKYGGSLNILLFEKGVYEGIEVHQGQRIGTMSEPS